MALLGSMAAVPGLVACGFLMGRIGRINMLCGGLFTAMIFALFLPLTLTAEAALLAILCLFSGNVGADKAHIIVTYKLHVFFACLFSKI